MNLASVAATQPVPATAAPAAPTHFVGELDAARKQIGWAQMMIGNDWYGPGDTSVAMDATRSAMEATGRALEYKVGPGGHVTPPAALEAARDGQAFLKQAYAIMDAEDFAPPVAARDFLGAASSSFSTAIKLYGELLEPTPKYP